MITFIVIITTSGLALADELLSIQKQNTFKAWVDAGVYYVTSTSANSTDGKKKITDNTKEGEVASLIKAFPLFDFRYTSAKSETKIYLGTSMESSVFGLSMGVVQPIKELGILSVSVGQGVDDKVWENPYEQNVNRSSTDVINLTTVIKIKKVVNTGLSISYLHTSVDVKNDVIGDLNSDLRRDGNVNSLGITYIIGLDKTSILIPGIEYDKGDFDGNSNSYDKTGMSFSYMKFGREYVLRLGVSASSSSYEKSHPVYDKTRNDNDGSCMAMLRFENLFNIESLHTNLIIGSRLSNSNIDFFDIKSSFTVATVGYSF